MQSLREEVEKNNVNRANVWTRLLDSLNDQDRKDLLSMMNDGTIPVAVIHRVLKGHGFRISAATLSTIRRDGQ